MTVREHSAMLNCEHKEADQLGPVCLHCGRLALPDPSWAIVAIGFLMLGLNVMSWWFM